MSQVASVADIWRSFLIDAMFAENYQLAYSLRMGPIMRNPVLERVLPGLLHIKAMAILDHALKAWLADRGIPEPKGFRNLDGRLKLVANQGQLSQQAAKLHEARDTRNDLAHESDTKINWKELDADVRLIHAALKEIGFVAADFPDWSMAATQEAAGPPEVPDAISTQHFHVRITDKATGRRVAEMAWRVNLYGS